MKHFFLFLLFSSLFYCGFAQGDLLVSPTRIVFEGKKLNQEIVLVNTGRDTAIYNVSFIQNRVKDDGAYERIEKPDSGQFFTADYVRFFPRTFILAPKRPQILRMQFRRTPDMKDGEYRSHLYFRAEPQKKELGAPSVTVAGNSGIKINIIPIYGVTIPVIIRYGNVEAKVNPGDLSLEMKNDTTAILRFTLKREGNSSVWGNIHVLYNNPDNKGVILTVMNGIALYTPNKFRTFEIELSKPPHVDFKTGKIIVRYSSENDAKPEVFSTKELLLGK